jgi:hypothetical protein
MPVATNTTTPIVVEAKPVLVKTVTPEDLSGHIQLAIDQLESVTLMMQVLDQTNGGSTPTE